MFAARAEDTARRKARTGKTVRMLKSELSEAWERPGAPDYLPTPLQGILYNEAHARCLGYAARRLERSGRLVATEVALVNCWRSKAVRNLTTCAATRSSEATSWATL